MLLSEKLLSKLNAMGIEYYADGDEEYTCVYLNGKQIVAFNTNSLVTLFDESGSRVKDYKNITSAIKATF